MHYDVRRYTRATLLLLLDEDKDEDELFSGELASGGNDGSNPCIRRCSSDAPPSADEVIGVGLTIDGEER